MNSRGCRVCIAVILFACLSGCAGVNLHPQTSANPSAPKVDTSVAPAVPAEPVLAAAPARPAVPNPPELAAPPADFWVDLVAARRYTDCDYDVAIENWAKRLTQSPANFNANLVRIQPYLDYVWRRSQELDMPSEVAMLPLVESDYRQVYGSYGSPGGWWQLMPQTARGYQLDVTRANDERVDPIKSTDVALKLMQQNADRFDNDWLLAIFAYNVGGQRIERVLSAKGIQPGQIEHVDQLGLPLTTENHLHRLLAWGCIFAHPDRYKVTLPEPLTESQRLTEVRVSQTTPVAAMVETLDSFGDPFAMEWKKQHPLIAKRGEITGSHAVLAPEQTNAAIAALGDLQRFKAAPVLAVVTKSGSNKGRARAGSRAPSGGARVNSRVARTVVTPQSFKVRNGDNLWTIARRFDMRVNEILALNPSISRNTVLKLGFVLRLK